LPTVASDQDHADAVGSGSSYQTDHNDTNGLDMSANDDYVRRSVYRWYDAVDRLLVIVDYGAGDASGAGEAWRYVAVPGTTSGAASLATTFGYFYGDDPYTSGEIKGTGVISRRACSGDAISGMPHQCLQRIRSVRANRYAPASSQR
jgi:hypothetical protein